MSKKETFESWAIVEAMGHQRHVGFVTETTLAGAAILRVDVPEVGERQNHTVYVSPQALFRLRPVDEETALLLVGQGESMQPLTSWSARHLLEPPRTAEVIDDGDDDDDRPF